MSELNHADIGRRLQNAQRVLILSHIRPDGDAVGSLLGMGLALQNAGKTVQMALSDGVPTSFRHLAGSDQVVRHPKGEFDLVVVLDCSDLLRVGDALNGYSVPDLNIDHHVTNLNFARLNLVEPTAVATSAILAEYLPIWGFPITLPIAAALLTGLISDTLGFRTSNMTPQALRLGALLMEAGPDLPDLYKKAIGTHSYQAVRYWGAGLLHLDRKDGLVWTWLSLADREAMNYPGNDDADLINVLSSIEDADIEVIFIEQKGDKVKVSWRARPGVDVSQIALQFGGGGHPAASGAEIAGSLDEVKERVLTATRQLLPKPENVSAVNCKSSL